MVAVTATQEMPNTKNETAIKVGAASKNSKTINNALKSGDTGKKVVSLQKILYKQGYYDGKIDGDFGPYTKKAVKLFQTDNSLKVNGIVDKTTSSKLKKFGYLKNYDTNKAYNSKTKTSDSKNLKSNNKIVSTDSSKEKSKTSTNSYKNSAQSSKSTKSSKSTIAITSLPSAGGSGLPYKWTTNTWGNYCPLCGKDGGLTINPKGVYEKELTCKYCDADYCGSSGKDKAYKSRATLTRA